MNLNLNLPALTLALAISGCAAPNPQWILKHDGLHCVSSVSKECVAELAKARYSTQAQRALTEYTRASSEWDSSRTARDSEKEEATNEAVSADAISRSVQDTNDSLSFDEISRTARETDDPALVGEGAPITAEVQDGDQLIAPYEEADDDDVALTQEKPPELNLGSIPVLGFGMASIGLSTPLIEGLPASSDLDTYIAVGRRISVTAAEADVALTGLLSGPESKAVNTGIYYFLATRSDDLSETIQAEAINTLYERDQQLYEAAMLNKLSALLRTGDLERAKALRVELVKAQTTSLTGFSSQALVAVAYTLAGYTGDAIAIVRSSAMQGYPISDDDSALIQIARLIQGGTALSAFDFDRFGSNQARVSAYSAMAQAAVMAGLNTVATEALSYGVRFIQKSGAGVDRDKELGLLLVQLRGSL